MKIIKTLIFVLFSIQTFAQYGSLNGHISYLEDSSDFSNITVLLLKDGKTITGCETDKNGKYEIKDIPFGKYDLKIYTLGFRDKIIYNYEIKENSQTENFIYPDPCKSSKRICPHGHNDNIIPILYGYPTIRNMKKAKKGKIKLGGCVVTDCDPKWHCKKHNIDF